MIDTDQKLAAWLDQLKSVPWVALDTEADSLHAYPEKLCLIQVASREGEALIDPLARMDLTPLWQALSGHELILHGADYDLRLLRKSQGFIPASVFDTMLASRLIGCRQFGLIDLVSKFLGVHLEKGPQKANWAQRPLTSRMAQYALNDTRYLHPLSEILRANLKEKGRLAWHQETCQVLLAEASRQADPDPEQVWRVKGSHQLRPDALAVLRELWRWREREATAANKPPYFILTPELMVKLSLSAVDSHPFESHLSPRMSPRRREGIKQAVARGLSEPHPPPIVRRRSHRPSDAEQKRFQELEKRRDARARGLDLDPTLIASRATLMSLARNWEDHQSELMAWQRQLLQEG